MTWVKFSDKKPKVDYPVITRSPGYKIKSECFEDWREWKTDILSYNPPPSHWWDGEFNFDLAVKSWDDYDRRRSVENTESSDRNP